MSPRPGVAHDSLEEKYESKAKTISPSGSQRHPPDQPHSANAHSELRKKWVDLFGSDPANLSKQYLVRRLAYRVQELTLGGLSKATRGKLASWAENPKQAERKTVREKTTLQLGTRLLRDWHGERYEVIVQEDGFLFQGKKYRSLSAIARAITGRHCGGRRFFWLAAKQHER